MTPPFSSAFALEKPEVRPLDSPQMTPVEQKEHVFYVPQTEHYLLHSNQSTSTPSYAISSGFPPEYHSPYHIPHTANPSQLPLIERLVPSEGPVDGGTEVTILGSGFYEGITCLFGNCVATTICWSSCTLVCVVPPTTHPGPVLVSFKGHALNTHKPNHVFMFNYVDNDHSLFELALQLVGMKMTGNLQDAKEVALRIVQGNQAKPKAIAGPELPYHAKEF